MAISHETIVLCRRERNAHVISHRSGRRCCVVTGHPLSCCHYRHDSGAQWDRKTTVIFLLLLFSSSPLFPTGHRKNRMCPVWKKSPIHGRPLSETDEPCRVISHDATRFYHPADSHTGHTTHVILLQLFPIR